MLKQVFSALLAFLVLGTMLVGECASCPLVAKKTDCCQRHSGDCRMPDEPRPARPACPQQALAPQSYHQIDFGAAHLVPLPGVLPAVAAPQPEIQVVPAFHATRSEHAPPDLYLLNSTLLV